MDELQYFIEQKIELLARESNLCPALDYSEGMEADEQKCYINYLADRVNADDLEKRAMKLVLQDSLDKQKEYDVRLSKLDAVLSDVEDLLTSSLIKCILCVTKSGNMSFLSNDVMRD
ncbi:hypothetical protein I6E38_12835 [Prevotella stercorea]|uniref:hypothetical protein n=1 Tax=Leyella stercorea TaxID=363265 RepID=UPI001F2AD8CB|nr:hypothetical protein [Leyella stercorea]MCF2579973.1 hypothetical protein [Leyella stercorea]